MKNISEKIENNENTTTIPKLSIFTKELKLRLPKSNLKISKKDKNLLTLNQFKKKYKYL